MEKATFSVAVTELKMVNAHTLAIFDVMDQMVQCDGIGGISCPAPRARHYYGTPPCTESKLENFLEEKYGSSSYRGATVTPVSITDGVTGDTIVTPFPQGGITYESSDITAKERRKDLQRATDDNKLGNGDIVFFSTGGNEDIQQYISKLCYNEPVAMNGGHLFSMLDAAGLSWSKREFSTPGDTNRPQDLELGSQDRQHYWSRTLLESFVASRVKDTLAKMKLICHGKSLSD